MKIQVQPLNELYVIHDNSIVDEGARYYEVYVNQDGKSFSNLTSRGNVYTAWSLKPGVVYDFTVSAFGEDKSKSRESKVLTASTSTEAPMQPILTDISSTEATLEWADIPGAVKYILYYVKDDEKKSQETTKTKIVVTDLEPGQWYDFSVVSVGSGGEKSEESDLLDEQTVPLIPANVRAKTVEMDHITVIWDKSAGASSYKLTYNWQDDDRETRKETVNTESTSVNLSNLTPGTKYEIKVLAIGQTGSRTQQSKSLIENTST
uniref:fibronectin-like n=1 Tax=Styela clava TaxID=7725 RepID=UPI0019394001|nr:fibronectin-like [Styela clava]